MSTTTSPPLGSARAAAGRARPAGGRAWQQAGLAHAAASLALPLALLAAWWAATAYGWVAELILPAPGAVWMALGDLLHGGDIAASLAISLTRVAAGFAIGAGCGLAVGALTGLSPRAATLLRPTLLAFVQVPVLAWIPLLMIPFGIGEALKLVAISLAAFTPVLVHTAKGFAQVPAALVEVGTLYRFGWGPRVRHILLPGALPAIFTGVRLGLTQAWQSLVVVELVASTDGIGYQCVMARQMFQLDQMLAIMVVIGVVGFALDRVLRGLEGMVGRRYGGVAA